MSDRVAHWIGLYRTAWESNEPEDIRALFTEDAEYRTEPYAPAWTGHEAIIDGWLEAADEPGETTFEWELLGEQDGTAFVQGRTVYAGGPTYANLWVVRLAGDGRASSFTEWYMDEGAGA